MWLRYCSQDNQKIDKIPPSLIRSFLWKQRLNLRKIIQKLLVWLHLIHWKSTKIYLLSLIFCWDKYFGKYIYKRNGGGEGRGTTKRSMLSHYTDARCKDYKGNVIQTSLKSFVFTPLIWLWEPRIAFFGKKDCNFRNKSITSIILWNY